MLEAGSAAEPGSAVVAGGAVEAVSALLRARPQDEAARKGVLQSGSSEDLARALANLTQMVSCARSETGQHGAPGTACLPASDNYNQRLRLPASCDQQTAPYSPRVGAPVQHQPSRPSLVFPKQTAQPGQADVGVSASGSMSLSLPHNLAAQTSTDTSENHSNPPSSVAAQPASQADRAHLESCRVSSTPVHSSLHGADLQGTVSAEMAATSQPRQADNEHGVKRKWKGLDASRGLQKSQEPRNAQIDLQPAAKRGRPGREPFQMEHRQQLISQLAWPACTHDAVQASPQAALSIAAGQDMQLDLRPAAGVKGLHATLR